MPRISIDFEWSKDSKGYRLEVDQRDRPWIVREGGELERCEPPKIETLYNVFSEVKTAAGLLEFVRNNGSLSKAGQRLSPSQPMMRQRRSKTIEGLYSHEGEMVEVGLEEARMFRDTLEGIEHLAVRPKRLKIAMARLLVDQEGARIQFVPDDLIDALRLQLAVVVSSGGEDLAICRYCGIPFAKGPGTKKRVDAEYCSEAHKKLFFKKNSP
jgi:hypothetical protein